MDKPQERRWNFWHWLGAAFAVYVLSFVALLFDAKFFNGKLIDSLGIKAHVLLAIYYPILKLLDYLAMFD